MISLPTAFYMLHTREIQAPREYSPTYFNLKISFNIYPSSMSLRLPDMYESWDRERIPLVFFTSLLRNNLVFWKIFVFTLCWQHQWNNAEEASATVDSPDHYNIKAGTSVKSTTPSPSLVQKPPQTTFLWALHYPFREQYTKCTWTAPGWAGHCTQQSFRVEDCPFAFTPTHNFAYHILVLQQRFADFSWSHGQTVIQHAPLLLENRFSCSTGIWRNMWT